MVWTEKPITQVHRLGQIIINTCKTKAGLCPPPLISDCRVSQSADDFSERSREREQRSLEEEQDEASPTASKKCTWSVWNLAWSIQVQAPLYFIWNIWQGFLTVIQQFILAKWYQKKIKVSKMNIKRRRKGVTFWTQANRLVSLLAC